MLRIKQGWAATAWNYKNRFRVKFSSLSIRIQLTNRDNNHPVQDMYAVCRQMTEDGFLALFDMISKPWNRSLII